MRLIDADKLIETLGVAKDCDDCPYDAHGFCGKSSDFVDACEAIADAPTVESQRMKAKWKRTKANSGYNAEWTCSNCGYTVYAEFCNYHYCSACGADMRGDTDEV